MYLSNKPFDVLEGYLEPALLGHIYLTCDEPYFLHLGGMPPIITREPTG